MDMFESFARLSLDNEKDKVVGHGQAVGKDISVIIPSTEADYEDVCRIRWGDYIEAKATIEARERRIITWENFYEMMEEINKRFAERRVYEQCRVFSTKKHVGVLNKKQKNQFPVEIPHEHVVTSVAANELFAAVLCKPAHASKPEDLPGGRLWIFSTSNLENTVWRPTDVEVLGFQAGFLYGNILYIVSSTLDIYKLPTAEHVYHLDVWTEHKVLLTANVNVIRATNHMIVIVTRQRGFIVWKLVNRQLSLLLYENPNTEGKQYQYTTASIYMNMIAFGTTDGYVEMWEVEQNDEHTQSSLKMVSRDDYFVPTVSTESRKPIIPTPHSSIHCVELCGSKLAVSTEKDFVMVEKKTSKLTADSEGNSVVIDKTSSGSTLCVLPGIATVASMRVFGDLICVLERDGGFMVSQFAIGRTFCNTTESVPHARDGCVIGQQWVFCCGSMVGTLMPNGALVVLNQSTVKNH